MSGAAAPLAAPDAVFGGASRMRLPGPPGGGGGGGGACPAKAAGAGDPVHNAHHEEESTRSVAAGHTPFTPLPHVYFPCEELAWTATAEPRPSSGPLTSELGKGHAASVPAWARCVVLADVLLQPREQRLERLRPLHLLRVLAAELHQDLRQEDRPTQKHEMTVAHAALPMPSPATLASPAPRSSAWLRGVQARKNSHSWCRTRHTLLV
jgi:hypothetical protein